MRQGLLGTCWTQERGTLWIATGRVPGWEIEFGLHFKSWVSHWLVVFAFHSNSQALEAPFKCKHNFYFILVTIETYLNKVAKEVVLNIVAIEVCANHHDC